MNLSLTLDDLFPHDKALVRVARGPDGAPAHIADVPNGRACACTCYECQLPLIARQGSLTWSFAHVGDPDANMRCASAGESALHAIAKEFIARRMQVMIPGVVLSDELGELCFSEDKTVKFDSVRLEAREGEVVPDIVGVVIGKSGVSRRIFIEIANHHPCPPEKLAKLAEMDVAVLEIDVSGYRDRPLAELEDVIVLTAPRKLIQAQTIRLAQKALAQRKADHERKRAERLNPMLELFRRPEPGAAEPSDVEEINDLVGTALEPLLGGSEKQPSCFAAAPKLWRATLLIELVGSHGDMSVGQWVVNIADKTGAEVVKPGLRYFKADDATWIREHLDAAFLTAREEAEVFMRELVTAGFAHVSHRLGRWRASETLRAEWLAITAPKKVISQRRAWLASARERVLEAVDVGCFDKDGPEFEAWLEGRAAARDMTVKALLTDKGAIWDSFEAALKNLFGAIRAKSTRMAVNSEGLPVERFFEGLRRERAAREEAHRLMNERFAAESAASRVEQLEYRARELLGDGADDYLDGKDFPARSSPREMARQSEDGLDSATAFAKHKAAIAEREARTKREMEAAADDLLSAATRHFGSADMAALWIKQQHQALGGKRPAEFCVDDTTLKVVIALFPKPEKSRR